MRRLRRLALVLTIAPCALLTFGISGADDAAVRAFDEAAGRWQSNPEFRAVANEYCVLGSRAVRTRPLLLRAGGAVMALRSLPFLPKRFAVNPTSQSHYDDFDRGPLIAYLHLCGEQSVAEYAGILERAGKTQNPSPDDLRRVMDEFKMDFPVCKDPGALQSVASMLRDTEASRPLTIKQDVGPLLLPHIAALARELGVPPQPSEMTPAQQLAVLERLDAHVRANEPELWRSKQLSDFCGGVWAQVFSPPYRKITRPFIAAHAWAPLVLVVLLAWLAFVRPARVQPAHPVPADDERRRADGPGAGVTTTLVAIACAAIVGGCARRQFQGPAWDKPFEDVRVVDGPEVRASSPRQSAQPDHGVPTVRYAQRVTIAPGATATVGPSSYARVTLIEAAADNRSGVFEVTHLIDRRRGRVAVGESFNVITPVFGRAGATLEDVGARGATVLFRWSQPPDAPAPRGGVIEATTGGGGAAGSQ